MKNLFLSHAGADGEIIEPLCRILKKRQDNSEIVFSSLAETGTRGGDELMPWINRNLEECEVFVAVITENYVRSLYCMYELNLALYLYTQQKLSKIIPICSSENVYHKVEKLLSSYGFIYLNAAEPERAGEDFLLTFSLSAEEDCIDQLRKIMTAIANKRANSPYIGCTAEEYNRYIYYCEEQKIRKIQDQSLPIEEIKQNLLACNEIVIFATTGIGVIRTLRENVFVDALLNGTTIHVITANPWSDFCEDVACIEDSVNDGASRIKPLADEFGTVFGYLREAYDAAKVRAGGKPIGNILFYCSYTLLRQTIMMGRKENGNGWCWLSMTMPPKRSNTKTPSLLLEGNTEDEGLLISTVWRHCLGVMEIAKKRKGWFSVSDTLKSHPFYLEKIPAREYWKQKFLAAMQFMGERREEYAEGFLIEVAAQHPLRGERPNREFEARLKCAVRLYKKLMQMDNKERVVKIYVPGSKHKFNGKTDPISLSAAGKAYLVSQGIPAEDIFGDEANDQYKREDGVYNSADECYVASELFKAGNYGCLFCICSPAQTMRKTLFYYEFGILPQCISVPTQKMFHSVIDELFDAIPNVLYRDHDWQDKTKEAFIESREERKP